MNKGQEMFYNFFIERVRDDQKEEAKKILEESFARQAQGTFDMTYMQEIMTKMYAMVKPEFLDEVRQAMEHFASTL